VPGLAAGHEKGRPTLRGPAKYL